jgi:hypothetical protein
MDLRGHHRRWSKIIYAAARRSRGPSLTRDAPGIQDHVAKSGRHMINAAILLLKVLILHVGNSLPVVMDSPARFSRTSYGRG